jgi:enoyl-CoA hydratase/carnithine racemase
VGAVPPEAAALVDTVVADLRAAQSLIANIRNKPLTAMTLVQVLRHNEAASINDGLLAESLAYATLQGGPEFGQFLRDRKPPPAPRTYDEPAVLCQRHDHQLAITLNRPDKRNAFSTAMRESLVEALQLLAQDKSISRAQIRGAGECFCVGGDLDEFGQFPDTATGHAIRSTRNAGRLISQLAERIECHVHRACIGAGIELPAFCHRIVASENTYFQLPEIKLGLVPGAGGTVSVLKRIGRHRTAWMGLSGKRVNANTALAWGLIDAIE